MDRILTKFSVLILLLAASFVPAVGATASSTGVVYTMTNALTANEVVVFERAADGLLSETGRFGTGGNGVGDTTEPVDALGSQGSMILTRDGRWLLVANAGSDEISVFRVTATGLILTDVEPSGGHFPASIAVFDGLVYVLNSGGDGNITGFTLAGGNLAPIAGSTRDLGAGGTNPPFFLVSPAQIDFSPTGEVLVVTEKGSNEIHVFSMTGGLPSAAPTTTISHGETPFGFDFDRRGHLIVAEPFGNGAVGDPGASAVSSYEINADGTLTVISASIDNLQTASCWIETTGNFAYATNNASDTITGYRVNGAGHLSLLDADGVAAHTDHAPVDLAATPDGRFLYALNAGDGTISMYAIDTMTGALTGLGSVHGLPEDDGAVGIVAR